MRKILNRHSNHKTTKTMEDTQTKLCALWVQADEATDTLAYEKKRAGAVYDERIRIISKFKDKLREARRGDGNPELIESDTAVAPEVAALLRAPLHGID